MIRITRKEAAETLREFGVEVTADKVILPRDFCLVGLLNRLGPYHKTNPQYKYDYEVAVETLRDLEALLGICDGARNGADDCWEEK